MATCRAALLRAGASGFLNSWKERQGQPSGHSVQLCNRDKLNRYSGSPVARTASLREAASAGPTC